MAWSSHEQENKAKNETGGSEKNFEKEGDTNIKGVFINQGGEGLGILY